LDNAQKIGAADAAPKFNLPEFSLPEFSLQDFSDQFGTACLVFGG
jgi:hypothetical protein